MKGRKVERLPDDIRKHLYMLLESKKFTSQEIADQVNDMLLDFQDETDVCEIDDNTVWREAKRMERITEQMSEAKAWADTMADKFDLSQMGEQGQILLSMMQSAAFKTASTLMGKSEALDTDTLGDLVLSVRRLQSTANETADFKKQIVEEARKEALKAAAKEMTTVAKERNLSPEDIVHIRERLYGIYDQPKALV